MFNSNHTWKSKLNNFLRIGLTVSNLLFYLKVNNILNNLIHIAYFENGNNIKIENINWKFNFKIFPNLEVEEVFLIKKNLPHTYQN